MALGHTNHPELITGLTNPVSWINVILSLLSNTVLASQAKRILTTPSTPTAGQIYLIGSPQTGTPAGIPGDIVVYTTSLNTSGNSITMPDGTVVGSYVKNGSDWTRDLFANMATRVFTTSTTITVPTAFDGTCFIVTKTTGVTINSTGSRTDLGLAGTSLAVGVYTLHQDATHLIIS
jgi:hypothetical protein